MGFHHLTLILAYIKLVTKHVLCYTFSQLLISILYHIIERSLENFFWEADYTTDMSGVNIKINQSYN